MTVDEWVQPGGICPVDRETTGALVQEIIKLRQQLKDAKTYVNRIKNLETAFDLLCKMMQKNTRAFPNHWTEFELIRQYAAGDLD